MIKLQLLAGKCEEVKDGFGGSDFPFKIGDKSVEEPGHYTWNGSKLTIVEEEDAIEAHKKVCEDGKPEDRSCRSCYNLILQILLNQILKQIPTDTNTRST